ncbi:MAG: ATP synthase F1 subunit epsilon [Candidatus Adiutrix sp.]|jgi:F-type H+-transporting ATPase subunit epsilon|nr:ATP synthase F1 subunit epsilon [Candidatus Adiutrix sp.]
MTETRIQLRVVTPDKTLVDTPVEAVGAVGSEGAFTALPGHLPFLTDLQPGLLWYRLGGVTKDIAVSGGFIEVCPDRASVLADSAEYLEHIDLERAQKALKRAEERLAQARADALAAGTGIGTRADITRATASFIRASTRIKLAARRINK